MKLYLVHCGFYDLSVCEGVYESHVNYFVAARDFEDARAQVRTIPEFRDRKMHVDGLSEVQAVQGHRIQLEKDDALDGRTLLLSHRHRDLAVKAAQKAQQPNLL